PRRRDLPGEENATFYEPRGVAVTIAPWNFPLAILCGMTAAALVTGNTAIMKPAEQSAVVAAKLMEVFEEAGFPPGVVNYLPGVVARAFGYAGQKCSACSRAIVLSPIYEPFLARLVEATRSLKVGPADDPAYSVGPVIDDDARRRIAQTIEQGKAEAKLAYAADVSALAE